MGLAVRGTKRLKPTALQSVRAVPYSEPLAPLVQRPFRACSLPLTCPCPQVFKLNGGAQGFLLATNVAEPDANHAATLFAFAQRLMRAMQHVSTLMPALSRPRLHARASGCWVHMRGAQPPCSCPLQPRPAPCLLVCSGLPPAALC